MSRLEQHRRGCLSIAARLLTTRLTETLEFANAPTVVDPCQGDEAVAPETPALAPCREAPETPPPMAAPCTMLRADAPELIPSRDDAEDLPETTAAEKQGIDDTLGWDPVPVEASSDQVSVMSVQELGAEGPQQSHLAAPDIFCDQDESQLEPLHPPLFLAQAVEEFFCDMCSTDIPKHSAMFTCTQECNISRCLDCGQSRQEDAAS